MLGDDYSNTLLLFTIFSIIHIPILMTNIPTNQRKIFSLTTNVLSPATGVVSTGAVQMNTSVYTQVQSIQFRNRNKTHTALAYETKARKK